MSTSSKWTLFSIVIIEVITERHFEEEAFSELGSTIVSRVTEYTRCLDRQLNVLDTYYS
jgi:hypothetical protein